MIIKVQVAQKVSFIHYLRQIGFAVFHAVFHYSFLIAAAVFLGPSIVVGGCGIPSSFSEARFPTFDSIEGDLYPQRL